MGEMEVQNRKRTRKNQLRRIILETVKIAGFLSVALIAPKVITGMKQLDLLPSSRQGDVVNRASKRLVQLGLLVWVDGHLRLSRKGDKELRALELRDYKIKKPRRWDKKWRVLIFDIPERRKALRDKIRFTLIRMGFERLQDSVWAFPYDCEDVIALLKADFHVGDDMLYMIVDSIERDGRLRQHFKLSGQ
jgi:DNA-binding transcriptional regulator PaaX